eukprot:TRINITY_DN4790_c0_g1_i1.p1 TRINITY_DN4790_c0_g1~~TRINITY_DN4790_c0_g1_i1.p1  ORF type:complete len:527 (-),score=113.23 TRINITY_DN4790_c0_g1_i1:13-1593(-)
MRPKIRVPESELTPLSMLQIIKDTYTKLCKDNNATAQPRFLLQVENRLDNEEILDILDLKNCNLDDNSFEVIIKSVEEAYSQKRKNDEILEDFSPFHVIASGNKIKSGDLVGSFLSVVSAIKADFGSNELGVKGAKELASHLKLNKFLEELCIPENDIFSEGAIEVLSSIKGNQRIKSFNLANNKIDPSASQSIIDILSSASDIIEIDFSDNNLGDACINAIMKAISSSKTLEKMNLTNTGITVNSGREIVAFFEKNGSVKDLQMGHIKLSPSIGGRLAAAIFNHDVITYLDLRFSNIDDTGTSTVFNSLSSNKTLTELILSGNATSKKGIQLLADALKKNDTLQRLGLRYCSISKSGFSILAEALSVNTGLLFLDLAHNTLDSRESAQKFAESISHAKTRKSDTPSQTNLEELNLAACMIGYKQMEELAEGFFRNQSITTLHLDGNEMTVKGIRALAVGIKHNHTVKMVTVQDTHIDEQDVISFLEKVGDDCSLDVVDCRKNKINLNNQDLIKARNRYNKYKILF